VISHDRWFLDRVATHILAYEGDEDDPAKWYWFEGNFASYEENKVARLGQDPDALIFTTAAGRPVRSHNRSHAIALARAKVPGAEHLTWHGLSWHIQNHRRKIRQNMLNCRCVPCE